jgi:UDP-MurNAc hydroxylase
LKFADPNALAAVEAYETADRSSERIVVEAEGQRYAVQRYCPHAGGDLRDASEVLPGRVLRCLNHYYEFSLDTGECRNGICPPLAVEPFDGPASR